MNVDHDVLRRLSKGDQGALDLGKAAEHLVCADLILAGYRCYLSDQGLSYDLVVDVNGRLVRVQVKATCFPSNMNATGRAERIGYTFHVRRRGKASKGTRLSAEHCDVVALVALDIQAIAYRPLHEVGQCCQLMPPDHVFAGKFKRSPVVPITGLPFSEAIQRIGGSNV
ncbi:group I intron-associated PD-(D/E)XK endonuclease [Methylobacterium oxalidis]|uniref:PD(D/E)XK endonuclease domain-containing protein n=1 Tax=Methylobacterium oxalidis TaxID=944322 RepID=A0A512J9A8_9HYPH|nr:group I intron-associated PD-(D/E)XK endonuclease [Methylobacterium oxalidis]GEP06439.1 hypothetical protein MOX02_44770 [Methylobacterium oxalidis]GJE33535.1 hypothetical protein LDDCCGHA_3735 [Methylobacterium oxalidis]GLS65479.1 hypothetical protein GCM10007888_38610 [Methylobacterium oxalidis]